MLNEKTGIAPGLLFMWLFSAFFGFGLVGASTTAARYMGANGYWEVLLAFLLALPVIAAIVALGRRFPHQSFIQYLPSVLGRFPGKLTGFLFMLFLVVLTAWATREVIGTFHLYFLRRTPLWAMALLVLLPSAYLALKGIEGITRLAAFMFPLAFLLISMNTLLSFQNFSLDHVRPVFSVNGEKLLLGAANMFYIFFPLAAVLVLYHYLNDKQKGQKSLIAAGLLASVQIFVFVICAIGVFGRLGVLSYNWAFLEMSRNTEIPYLLQTSGMFFPIVWLSQLFVGIGAFYFAAAQSCTELFSALNYKWFVWLLFPAILALSLATPGTVATSAVFDYVRWSGLAIVFAIPLLVWLVARLYGRGEPSRAS